MRGVHFFMFLVAIPFFAAIGFDCYLWYLHQDKPFELTTPGYIWTHYDPDSYKLTVESTDKETWSWINFFLAQKSVVDGALFAGFFYFILLLFKILKVGPFRGESSVTYGSSSRTDEILGKKAKKFKYKRK